MSSQELVKINKYSFSEKSINDFEANEFAKDCWPLVYVLSDNNKKFAYIGETTDALTRMSAHLKHQEKKELTVAHLISSQKFNKSATLDVESRLIKYISADGQFKLMNGNDGLSNHNYYQKESVYEDLFSTVWDKLRHEGIAKHSLEHIDNSDLFKYSPYKSLSSDQRQGLISIAKGLLDSDTKTLLITGGAGTGKSILAIFLFKLLQPDNNDFNFQEFSDDEDDLRMLVNQIKEKFSNPKMGLVVPMSSFRKTLQKAFANVNGLSAKMVIGPAEVAKEKYDIILVDESHRLRKRVNLGAYFGAFDKAAEKLGFDKAKCDELDWILKQSKKSIFFYDESQSIKPSDANKSSFESLKLSSSTKSMQLKSQFRVKAGNDYVRFVHNLLDNKLGDVTGFSHKNYELALFDSISDFVDKIKEKNSKFGLSRMIAGYSWKWISNKDKSLFDINIDGVSLRWNKTNVDWINSENSVDEVGCIHTTQGYDLNYSGIIFGNEITYDPSSDEIVINEKEYFDSTGKNSIKSPEELKKYILNIYRTIMLRGIKGTFIYACNDELREYLSRYIPYHSSQLVQVEKSNEVIEIEPYVNAVPLFDLQVAAGGFSSQQITEHNDWINVPKDIAISEEYFACNVIGESMNKIIPNGSICLFRKDRGGSRNGKIVLVQQSEIIDTESGSNYTVKEYRSIKTEDSNGWSHSQITLNPQSIDTIFQPLILTEDQSLNFKVVGEFVRVLL